MGLPSRPTADGDGDAFERDIARAVTHSKMDHIDAGNIKDFSWRRAESEIAVVKRPGVLRNGVAACCPR